MVMLDAAETIDDLKVPPGNRLEALKGDHARQHSIRINQQWRICFVWTPSGPEDVEIVEIIGYHEQRRQGHEDHRADPPR